MIYLEAICTLFLNFVQIYKMHRLIPFLVALFFLSVSCKKELPKGILPKEQMAELMTQVHLIDGYISNLPSDSSRKVMIPLYQQLFQQYDLDSASFTKNLDYYLGNPALTEDAYQDVLSNLEQREADYLREDSVKHAIMQDSIRRVTFFRRKIRLSEDMIERALADSLAFGPADGTRRLYEIAGLWPLWEKNILKTPEANARQADLPSKEEQNDLPKLEASPSRPVVPAETPAASEEPKPAVVRELQYKPVRRSK